MTEGGYGDSEGVVVHARDDGIVGASGSLVGSEEGLVDDRMGVSRDLWSDQLPMPQCLVDNHRGDLL